MNILPLIFFRRESYVIDCCIKNDDGGKYWQIMNIIHGKAVMIKFAHYCLVAIALTLVGCNAGQATKANSVSKGEPSYACRVMLDRGSEMFCERDKA